VLDILLVLLLVTLLGAGVLYIASRWRDY